MYAQLNQPLNESSFNGQLNKAINTQHNYDFALMLACQTQNVAEHAQFLLPKTQEAEKTDEEAQLKASLGIHPYLKLAADEQSYHTAVESSVAIHQNGIKQAKLIGYLQSEALSQFNDANKLDDHLLANLDRHSIYRMQQAQQKACATDNDNIADATQLYDILNDLDQINLSI